MSLPPLDPSLWGRLLWHRCPVKRPNTCPGPQSRASCFHAGHLRPPGPVQQGPFPGASVLPRPSHPHAPRRDGTGRDGRARRVHGCPEAAQPGSRVGSHSGLEEVPLLAGTGSVQLVPGPPPPHFQPWAPVRYSCLPTTSPPCVPAATLRGLLCLCLKQLSLCQRTH